MSETTKVLRVTATVLVVMAIVIWAGVRISGSSRAEYWAGFRNSCIQQMVASPAGYSQRLAQSVCDCMRERIMSDPAARLVLPVAVKNHRMDVFQEDINACVNQVLPALAEVLDTQSADHVLTGAWQQTAHQDSDAGWDQDASRFMAVHPDLRYGHNVDLMNQAMREVLAPGMSNQQVLAAGYEKAKAMPGWARAFVQPIPISP